jgi:hypothetical protein
MLLCEFIGSMIVHFKRVVRADEERGILLLKSGSKEGDSPGAVVKQRIKCLIVERTLCGCSTTFAIVKTA